MKTLVCGGRDFSDAGRVFRTLDAIRAERGISCIVHGDASGADRHSERWAKERQLPYRGYPAPWRNMGRAAGTWRNAEMLRQEHNPQHNPDCDYCHGAGEYQTHLSSCQSEHCALAAGYDDCAGRMERCDCVLPGTAISLVVAFPGGVGTAHMVKLAKTAGIEVVNG
jgi:hypothetical protein